MRLIPLAAIFIALMLLGTASASYTVRYLNVTAVLNKNSSAQVTEILTVQISNNSVNQYSINRVALNLTLSDWQNLVGMQLTQHIINTRSGVSNFKLLPGAVTSTGSAYIAYLLMSYTVNNATIINQTAPRTFLYRFDTSVLNFQHGLSGVVLNQNTSLTIVLPSGALIKSVYPLPDYPPSAFTTNYQNVTRVSWFYGEPLSKFTLTFSIIQGIQDEVLGFFTGVFNYLGISAYVLIIGIILLFVIYAYVRAGR